MRLMVEADLARLQTPRRQLVDPVVGARRRVPGEARGALEAERGQLGGAVERFDDTVGDRA